MRGEIIVDVGARLIFVVYLFDKIEIAKHPFDMIAGKIFELIGILINADFPLHF